MSQVATSMVLGGGLSGIGGLMGAASANRAARKARDWYDDRTRANANRYGSLLYGPGFSDWSNASFGGDATAPAAAGNGPLLSQLRSLSTAADTRQGQVLRDYDSQTGNLGRREQGSLARIDDLYAGAEGMAGQFGRDAERLIDEDAAKSLRVANRLTTARSGAMGLGNSTLTTQSMAGNARDIGDAAARSKVGVRQAATDRSIAARGARGAAVAGTLARINDLYQARAGGRTGLQVAGLERSMAGQRDPINLQLSALSGNVLNPWLGTNTMQYYPGMSGAGSAAGGVGNAMAQYGSLLTMRDLFGTSRGGRQYQYPAPGDYGPFQR